MGNKLKYSQRYGIMTFSKALEMADGRVVETGMAPDEPVFLLPAAFCTTNTLDLPPLAPSSRLDVTTTSTHTHTLWASTIQPVRCHNYKYTHMLWASTIQPVRCHNYKYTHTHTHCELAPFCKMVQYFKRWTVAFAHLAHLGGLFPIS